MKLISIVLASALIPAAAFASPQPKNTQNHKDSSATSAESVEVEAFEWSSGQGRLGLMLEGLTPQLRAYFGAPNDAGLLVAQVAPDSPAARAGVQVGDVITQVNHQRVQGADDIMSATRASSSATSSSTNSSATNRESTNAGMASKVQIHVIRNHAALDLQATLGGQTKTPGS